MRRFGGRQWCPQSRTVGASSPSPRPSRCNRSLHSGARRLTPGTVPNTTGVSMPRAPERPGNGPQPLVGLIMLQVSPLTGIAPMEVCRLGSAPASSLVRPQPPPQPALVHRVHLPPRCPELMFRAPHHPGTGLETPTRRGRSTPAALPRPAPSRGWRPIPTMMCSPERRRSARSQTPPPRTKSSGSSPACCATNTHRGLSTSGSCEAGTDGSVASPTRRSPTRPRPATTGEVCALRCVRRTAETSRSACPITCAIPDAQGGDTISCRTRGARRVHQLMGGQLRQSELKEVEVVVRYYRRWCENQQLRTLMGV